MVYLKIIRPVNLLLIAIVQILIKYVIFDVFEAETAMNDLQFALLLVATLAIAAAGNVVNDIYDVEIDRINKPEKVLVGKTITEKRAFNYFIFLNVIGVVCGFILANQLGKPGLAATFIVISALLYIYSTQLKAMLILGNVLISALVSFSLLIVLIFDLYPIAINGLSESQQTASEIVLHYAIFAFVVNLIREIVKDLEDINGDKNGGINTLAIALGRNRTTMLVFVLAVLTIIGIVAYLYTFLYNKKILVLYFLFLVVAPLLYFCIKAWDAESKKEYKNLSLILKLVMVTGMCAMICYRFI
ncbi:MAG: geranylgeranylglycerol-phosphate geranylgeranyltransferase [Bacteroidia bacterium]|nr:geranylgeranylglycerol-phosphate geranylgeranyltransferase [Bacteroidia bacterium]NNF31345.1 geranylgeranylglycerol-phosphate geranylgeranyltransferase [Flavobacteriaceae bacterium]MBT8276579.1 geranylgeranylglycerol-phosphate geranylgeranyltransferase [Bacteroidia bacterium]NNJ82556.1 geranylgeranylglycerol-phosphate geranylgeranyltransferase [Flavobacteriaceae bacterium]NNK54381.1 geranylgeranylglycerol-phosphate geranylgeranyltransferase [Flavobacteriaceae bacterium]